jgi:polyhydroxyalkanoate synthase
MIDVPQFADPKGYLESLMHAGQDAMKQFDDALASEAGLSKTASLPCGQYMV